MYDDLPPTSSINGPYAAAVPAELKGLEKMHQLHGKVSENENNQELNHFRPVPPI